MNDQRPPASRGPVRRGRLLAYLVLTIWVGILAVSGPLAGKVEEVEDNSPTSVLPRSSAALEVERLLPRFRDDSSIPVVVVYAREGGLTVRDRTAIATDVNALRVIAYEGRLPPVVESAAGDALLVTVPLDTSDDYTVLVADVRQAVAGTASDGLAVGITGPAAQVADLVAAFVDLDTTLLIATGAVVALLLLLTYRSPLLWLLPLGAALVAIALSQVAVYLLAKNADLPVDGQSGGILTVLVFGVATDYALLLISRYRDQLRVEARPAAAMAVALRRTVPAVAASAATVTLGLLCLFAADLNTTRSLGGVGAAGVLSAFVVMTTLLPAALIVLGRWIFWPFVPHVGSLKRQEHGGWSRLAAMLDRRSRVAWVGSTVVLLSLSAGVLALNVGTNQEEAFRSKPGSVIGQELLSKHFPSGASAPALVVADADAADDVTAALVGLTGIARAGEPVLSADGRLVLIEAVLADAPDTRAAEATIERARAALDNLPVAAAVIGGPTASKLDTESASLNDMLVIVPLILLVVLIVLIVLLRSAAMPLLLLTTVVLSYAAALGAGTLILHAMGIGAVDANLLLLSFLFLVALGVDYNIFLMSRVRQEMDRLGHRRGVLTGLTGTGGVITSAGVVLAATFAVFIGLPIVFLIALGMVVAVGVLLDTLLVRSVLVPALALDLGPGIWWPRRLRDTPGTDLPAAPVADERPEVVSSS